MKNVSLMVFNSHVQTSSQNLSKAVWEFDKVTMEHGYASGE